LGWVGGRTEPVGGWQLEPSKIWEDEGREGRAGKRVGIGRKRER